jgi:hypothetical protein
MTKKQHELTMVRYTTIVAGKLSIIKASINNNLKSLSVYNNELKNYNNIYTLLLNFKRNRFFASFDMSKSKKTIFNNSLGIISKRFSEKKSFLKSKNSYIMNSSYTRRVLIYMNVVRMQMVIQKTPKFLKDIVNTLTTASNSLYKNPFVHSKLVNEKELNPMIYFEYLVFVNNKALGPIKKKKRGRLKRKIHKKIIAYNNMLD